MIRANEEIRLRWMQRYKTNPMADVATWYLDDIRIRVWNRQCFTQVLSENFTAHPGTMSGVNGIEYRLRDESISENRCNGGVSEGSALYFNRLSGQDVFRRSLIIIIQPAYELGECETTRSHTSELSDHSCQLPTPKQLEERVQGGGEKGLLSVSPIQFLVYVMSTLSHCRPVYMHTIVSKSVQLAGHAIFQSLVQTQHYALIMLKCSPLYSPESCPTISYIICF